MDHAVGAKHCSRESQAQLYELVLLWKLRAGEQRDDPTQLAEPARGTSDALVWEVWAELVQTVISAVLTGSLGLTFFVDWKFWAFQLYQKDKFCKRSVGAHSTLLLKLSMGDLTEGQR